jgi:hypothetical protein
MKHAFRLVLAVVLAAVAPPTHADPVTCQKQLVKQLLKYEKIYVKLHAKCLDLENLQKIPGPCPDATATLKIDTVNQKVADKISGACTTGDLTALGFPPSCALGASSGAAQDACGGLPVATVAEAVECIKCWKSAELAAYTATLYASHAVEVCGALDDTSGTCTPLGCTTPLPDQRNLTGSEVDCQRGIGKAGVKYLVSRSKALIACGVLGGTQASCLADADVQQRLASAEAKKMAVILGKCGNQDPEPSPAFCCRTTGNICVAAATRDDCVTAGGEPQENKFCDVDDTCASVAGNKQLTWWGSCPTSEPCPGAALATTGDLIDCVDGVADRLVDRLLCLQFRGNGGADWPCPGSPSGAFL